jgi:3-oxoacyl-[acyl-carrier protein] reductase
MDIAGRVALVTGGSGDIGGAIARALADAGAEVAISYVGDTDRANATVGTVQDTGRRCVAVRLDQRDPKSIDECARELIDSFGRLDILVNNAAWNIGIPFGDLESLTAEVWDRVLET